MTAPAPEVKAKSVDAMSGPQSSDRRRIIRFGLKALAWCLVLILLDRAMFFVLRSGYDRYFGLANPCELVFVGNSRTALGVDHKLVEKELKSKCGKFALNGATSQTRFAMLQYLCQTQPSCSTVVLDVSAYSFNDKNLSSGAYTLLYPYMNSEPVQKHVSTHSTRFGELLLRQLFYCSRFNSTTLNLAVRGLLGRDDNLKFSKVDLDSVRHRIETGKAQSLDATPDGIAVFEQTLKLLRDNKKKVVLLYMPVVKALNDVDRQKHDQNIARFKELDNQSANIFFLDLNRDNEENYEIMFDGIHVNNKGKKQLSKQIATFLRYLP